MLPFDLLVAAYSCWVSSRKLGEQDRAEPEPQAAPLNFKLDDLSQTVAGQLLRWELLASRALGAGAGIQIMRERVRKRTGACCLRRIISHLHSLILTSILRLGKISMTMISQGCLTDGLQRSDVDGSEG